MVALLREKAADRLEELGAPVALLRRVGPDELGGALVQAGGMSEIPLDLREVRQVLDHEGRIRMVLAEDPLADEKGLFEH